MNTIILTKNQIWQLGQIIQEHKLDQVKITIDNSNGIGQVMIVDFGPNTKKFDITDVTNW